MAEEQIPEKKQEKQYKTDGGKTKSNAIEVPSISLPKGGGAIKGIDQKFTVNAVNGTASLSVPLPVSQARGAVPALNLSYNSGGGNGIFGLGWNISLPSIKRKTDKLLPQYNDYADSDIYLLSEAEDLVPEYLRYDGSNDPALINNPADIGKFIKDSSGKFIFNEDNSDTTWSIRFYKPRIEGLFARIERWTKKTTGEIKWRVISKDNMITLYGWDSAGTSRISDPANTLRIYEWLPEMVIDDKGNCAYYRYKAEDGIASSATVQCFSKPYYRNRFNGGAITYTNKYISKILYGNATPYAFGSTALADTDFMFETAFDYGEYDPADPHISSNNWDLREDAFSEYKTGFEIRTTRLCKRVLLFHHFPDVVSATEQNTYLVGGHALVKSLDFNYDNNGTSGFCFLKSVTSKGFIRYFPNDNPANTHTYSSKNLPPLVFEYQAYGPSTEVKEIDPENVANAPTGLSRGYQFTDLFNEGLSGILSEQAGAWFYKSNFGDGVFGAARMVSPKPSFNGLNGNMQLIDLDGDGLKQMVNFSDSPQGYFEITDDPDATKGAGSQWRPFKSFHALPNINFKDPHAKLVDLNGDGKTDVLMTEDTVFTWWESDGKEGFKDYHRTPKFTDEEQGPKLVFAESTQTIFLADMSGDGLVDLVRIRNGEVCYWPNLGYGRFGKKVQMENSPVMDNDADFNPSWVKLADIDGSGTPDLIYLGRNKFSYWMNFSGNSYSAVNDITGFPSINPDVDVTVTDLLGNGLSCIVWSSSSARDASAPLRYIDLMNSIKPHILIKHRNGLGQEVQLEYTPSTKYYVEDKLNGMPWATRLHFPVHCLSKVITTDKVTEHTFTSTYTYHHGYYDHAEKEFRGFGRVDQLDIEVTENYENNSGTLDEEALNQAPVLTRSWFHTGAYLRDKKILGQFENEYWYNEYNRVIPALSAITVVETNLPAARMLPDGLNAANIDYVTDMSPVEKRQAYRSCKSMPLRVEVFALEGTAEEQKTPFTVSTHNCMIELLQPMGDNKYAVYCVKESEAITYTYERSESDDPRISHTLNLEMDLYGNVLKSASVVYPRLVADTTLPARTQDAQNITYLTYAVNAFTNDVSGANTHRIRLPLASKTYEVTLLSKTTSAPAAPRIHLYALQDFSALGSVQEIPYEDSPSISAVNKRLIESVFSRYYKNDLTGELDGTGNIWLHSLGIPFENYQLAYTENTFSDLLTDIFGSKVMGTDMLMGQFENIDDDWWIRSGVVKYIDVGASETASTAAGRFYVPISYTNQYGSKTIVSFDTRKLFVEQVESLIDLTHTVAGNITRVQRFDYRTLQPAEMKDHNDNLSGVIVDELGLPKAMILKSKDTGTDKADEVNTLKPYTLKKTLVTDPDEEQDIINNYFTDAALALTPADVNYSGTLQTKAAALLERATARFVYDFNCYDGSGNFVKPAAVSSILREEHYNINSSDNRTQLSFEYSNGMGKVVMKKVQAEAGVANQVAISSGSITVTSVDTTSYTPDVLRWIGNGRTVFNNKGKPVKQYEPFFSTTAGYEDAAEMVEQGVTPLLHYDALGRMTRTDFPDGTFSKTEYFGWKQVSYDQNDTVQDSAWYDLRDPLSPNLAAHNVILTNQGKDPAAELDASAKSLAHYNTPKTIHFDTLGRPVTEQEIIITPPSTSTTLIYTHLVLDIESNLREVWGPKTYTPSLPLMKYKYDMLGQMVYQESLDSGNRWLLHDCMGSPLITWDQRNFEVQFDYDILHRPLQVNLIDSNPSSPVTSIVDLYQYGEGLSSDKAKNLRGSLYRHWDSGGLEETAEYYFKGQPKQTERWLASAYKNTVDWTVTSGKLETTSYVIATQFDALGRIKLQTAPDTNTIKPAYNERGLFYAEQLKYSTGSYSDALKEIDYDAKGQRSYIKYGNDVVTNYYYDEQTFRVTRILTQKSGTLQDLKYTYDAVGNITRVKDDAVKTIFYNNTAIDAISDYTYDSLYRLVIATGRELNDVANFGTTDNWDNSPFLDSYTALGSVALQNYTQTYAYDVVGNMTSLQHAGGSTGSYTRTNLYSVSNNRLSTSQIGSSTPYTYSYHAAHGYLTSMPHLKVMNWNFKEELVASSTQAGANPETTYYQYDSNGKRLRKITENATAVQPPLVKEQRLYIEGYEYYEKFGSGSYVTKTLSLIDNGQRFLMVERTTKSGITSPLTRYIHPNHQASCNLETDDSGNVITYEEYHPFGTTAYQLKNPSINALAKRYRYTGMERDDETGLNYHNARYYIPWLGRWLNSDPIGIEDGMNVYAYCQNNPLKNKDQNGTQTTDGTDGRKLEDYESPPDFYDRLNEAGRNMFHNATGSFSKTISYNVADGNFNVHFDVSILLNNQSGETSLDELVKAINSQEISTSDPDKKINYSISFSAVVLGPGESANPNEGEVQIDPPFCLSPTPNNVVGQSIGGAYPVNANVYTYRPGEENKPVDWKESAITVIHEFLHPVGLDDLETQWDYKIPTGPEGMIGFTPGETAIAPDVYIIPDSNTTYKSTGVTKMEYVRENLYNYARTIIDGKSFKNNSKPGQYLEKLSPDQMFILNFMISKLMQKK